MLAWDIRPSRVAGNDSLDAAWLELAKPASREAFKAEEIFLAAPTDAVKLFADRIQPEAPLEAKRVERLLAGLDSDRFAEREAASKGLRELGRRTKPFLDEALRTTKSTDAQDRARKLLAELRGTAPSSNELREIRAVYVLELIGDDAPKKLLNVWAGGPAGSVLTEEATAALKRLHEGANGKR